MDRAECTPVVILRNTVLFPGHIAEYSWLHLSGMRTRRLLDAFRVQSEKWRVAVFTVDSSIPEPGFDELLAVGTFASMAAPSPRSCGAAMRLNGLSRCRVRSATSLEPFLEAQVDVLRDEPVVALDGDVARLRDSYCALLARLAGPETAKQVLGSKMPAGVMADLTAAGLDAVSAADKQPVLQAVDVRLRIGLVLSLLHSTVASS